VDLSVQFKKPGEYGGDPPIRQPQGLMPPTQPPQTGPVFQPQTAQIVQPSPVTTPSPTQVKPTEGAVRESGENTCKKCNGTLIFSLGKGLWFCPACLTEDPSLPPPTTEEEPEDEVMEQTQEMIQQAPTELPAGPLPEAGEEPEPPIETEKLPDEVGGITKGQATESIIEIQNLIEAKAQTGVYSMDAESSFESCKLAFSSGDYPAVKQLTKQIQNILEAAEKEKDEAPSGIGEVGDAALLPGGKRQQAIQSLDSAKGLIFEAEKLGYDVTESKKIFKQAEPSYKAGDYEAVINFANDVEESVNAVLGGKRLAKAPVVQPRLPPSIDDEGFSDSETKEEGPPPSFFNKEFFLKFLLPIGGLIVLMVGLALSWIALDDTIWNPFNGPGEWGPYNTAGVMLGGIGIIVGILFAIIPLFLVKKVYVRMEPPKPVQMQ
jgi:uncharacterized Zn finger protein (UPF0148 family)